jgi:uncharacterized protein YndB with AHSA1/START domain
MPDIQHRIIINGSPKKIYHALTTAEGLSSWWTKGTKAEAVVGYVAEFPFGDSVTKMEILDLKPDAQVKWKCVSGPNDWLDSIITFNLEAKNDASIVRFVQHDHKAGDFYGHCNTKWAYFLLSLKSYLETGKGSPYPDDVKF